MSRGRTPWRVGVVIPAHDEVGHIADAIASVVEACAQLPPCVRTDVVVVADSCTDATAAVATDALAGAGSVIVGHARSVGVSRATGTEHVLGHLLHPLDRTWLANTDADSIVPQTWLTEQLALADRGATAVAGLIEVDSFADLAPGTGAVFLQRYSPTDGRPHTHVHGANLGVRADAYRAVGGWNDLVTAEDHDLWHRLRTRKWPVRAVSSIVVRTSGRRIGRAPNGFALGLDQLSREVASYPGTAA